MAGQRQYAVLMGDFDCCTPRAARQGNDHEAQDATSRALASALTRVRVETAAKSDAESELARVRRELGAALNTITGLKDELDAARRQPVPSRVVVKETGVS